MNLKRMLFVIVAVVFCNISGYVAFFPWTLLFGIIGGGMVGHATHNYVKER